MPEDDAMEMDSRSEGAGKGCLEELMRERIRATIEAIVEEELEGALKGKVWVVGSETSDRRFLEEVFFPAKVLTVNTVFLADGEKKTKVIVPGRRSERRIGDFDKLRDAVKQARGIELLVETEREAAMRAY